MPNTFVVFIKKQLSTDNVACKYFVTLIVIWDFSSFGVTSKAYCYLLQDDLLKILGEKHPLYDFLDSLSIKCSYLLFNKEYVKEILLEVAAQKSTGDTKLIVSWMTLLVVMCCFVLHFDFMVLNCFSFIFCLNL